MKLAAHLALACLAATASAQPIESESETAGEHLALAGTALEEFTASVAKYTEGDNVQGMITEAEQTISFIVANTTAFEQGPMELGPLEIILLPAAIEALREEGDKLAKEFKARSAIMKDAGQCEKTRTEITRVLESTTKLVASYKSKILSLAVDFADEEDVEAAREFKEYTREQASEVAQDLERSKDTLVPGLC
ncbi:hypothetical protein HIM_00377 [Hirsutella minnesotensis 3608]|nr:hypothetical protein HIM_00377 [Hirsutella minnesotensis 3608]